MRQRLLTPYILACLSAAPSFACDTPGRGPLEIFHGPDVAVGAGIARTELRFGSADRLVSASVVLDDAALASLPATGSTIEHILPLAADAPRTVFDHVKLDWNPEGQPAPRVYGQPHLGVHFYLIPEQQRNAMTLADPAFAAKAAKAPSQEEMAPDHVADPTGVLRMGTHWLDGRSRSWQDMRDRGEVVGRWDSADGRQHGFHWRDGVFTSFDAPDALHTLPDAISAGGEIVGLADLGGGRADGFHRNGEAFRRIVYPGAIRTVARGINARGDIVGKFEGPDSRGHGYVLRAHRRGTQESAFGPRLVTSDTALTHRSLQVRAEANDNRRAAGTLRDGVLTVALEVQEAMWHPDGDHLPGTNVEAFREEGGNPSVPGPLIRVPAGTEIRGFLRNSLPTDTITFYVPARLRHDAPADQLDSLIVPPGEVRPLRISATRAGTYLYRAVSGGQGSGRAVLRMDALLGGALIVDSAGATVDPRDRVLVMQGLPDMDEATPLPPVMAINGRSWPHTERLLATVGDTLRWRLINASTEFHPMHLHGFHYRVDAFDSEARNAADNPSPSGRMVVTQRMPPASTMTVSWVAEREGNWLFHCHFQRHVLPHQDLPEATAPTPVGAHVHAAGHALTSMSGLVMGILVTAGNAGEPTSPGTHDMPRRRLRLVAVRDSGFPDSIPSMRFVLEEPGVALPLEAPAGFSPTIDLVRGEPVSIMVVNRLTEPTAVHWHGIELESYFDGVPDFSGAGARVAPIVAPQDSFEVLMTPPRSGTFIYHSHVDEPRQHRAGLVGALIVRNRSDGNADDDVVIFIKSARAGVLASPEFEINGQPDPDTLVLRVGRQYRLRLIGLQVSNPNAEVTLTARADSVAGNPRDTLLVQWRPVAKDAVELPRSEQMLRPARQVVTMGETYDFLFLPTSPGQLRVEVRVSVPRRRLMVRLPIRVESATGVLRDTIDP